MYKPSDSLIAAHAQRKRWMAVMAGVTAVALVGALLQGPSANAGITAGDDRVAAPARAASAPAAAKPGGRYQLRCWQYGRLLFDEGPVSLAPEARVGARLLAYDRSGAPLIVSDAGGTTCLARPAPAAPNLALPR